MLSVILQSLLTACLTISLAYAIEAYLSHRQSVAYKRLVDSIDDAVRDQLGDNAQSDRKDLH